MSLTGNRDVDIKFLSELPFAELQNIARTYNRYVTSLLSTDQLWKLRIANEFGVDYANYKPPNSSVRDYYLFLRKYWEYMPRNMLLTPKEEYEITFTKHIHPFIGSEEYYSLDFLLGQAVAYSTELIKYYLDLYLKLYSLDYTRADISNLMLYLNNAVANNPEVVEVILQAIALLVQEGAEVNAGELYEIFNDLGKLKQTKIYKRLLEIFIGYLDLQELAELNYTRGLQGLSRSSGDEEEDEEYYSDEEEGIDYRKLRLTDLLNDFKKRYIRGSSLPLFRIYDIMSFIENDRYDLITALINDPLNKGKGYFLLAEAGMNLGYYFILKYVQRAQPQAIQELLLTLKNDSIDQLIVNSVISDSLAKNILSL